MAVSTIKAIKRGYVEKSFTIATGSFAEVSIAIPSNAIGISGINIYGTGSALTAVYGFYIEGSNAVVKVTHRGSGTGSNTLTARAYYLAD